MSDTTTEAVWEIPEPLSVCEVPLDGHTITRVRRHGNPSGPRLVLSHGNGLAIDLYYPFWSLLADEFDLMVYDLRNHGWNAVGDRRNHNIPTLIRDHDTILETIVSEYGEKPTIGIFHSVSALVTLFSPDAGYCARVLFDPPLCKPGSDLLEFDAAAERSAAITRSRSPRFERREHFSDLLRYMPAFQRVVPGVRELMAATTLRAAVDGQGYELRCPREFEAQIMDYVRGFSPLVDLSQLSCPTKVIGADPTVPFAYLPAFDLSDMMAVDYDFIPDSTHMLQLEDPEECVATIRPFLDQYAAGQ